jgi:hypothetical protein
MNLLSSYSKNVAFSLFAASLWHVFILILIFRVLSLSLYVYRDPAFPSVLVFCDYYLFPLFTISLFSRSVCSFSVCSH